MLTHFVCSDVGRGSYAVVSYVSSRGFRCTLGEEVIGAATLEVTR